MFVSFHKTLCKLGSVRIGAGVRLKGGAGAMLALLFAVLNLYWYLMLGALWMIFGVMWLMWKLFLFFVIKPIKWFWNKMLPQNRIDHPKQAQNNTATNSNTEQIRVLVTQGGSKFHLDGGCPSIRGSETELIDLEQARAKGYTPCAHCAMEYFSN